MKTKGLQEKYRKDFAMKNLIHNTSKSKPYVDTTTGSVYWGTDVNDEKERRKQ